MTLEIIMLSEISQTERDKYHMISLYMWNLKHRTKKAKMKTDSQIQRTNGWLPEGREWGEAK